MKDKKGIFEYLDCSVFHISEEASAFLDECSGRRDAEVYCAKTAYGYFLFSSEDSVEDCYTPAEMELIPECVLDVIRFGHEKGVRWIKLDACGEEFPERLKVYEWT